MEPLEIKKLISDILSNLTGEYETDLNYLTNQLEIYKNHENRKEILRAIGRAIEKITPEDKKEDLKKVLELDSLKADLLIDEANFCIYKKEFNKAYSLLNEYLCEFEKSGMFVDDELSEYHCFQHGWEELLYLFLFEPKKDCRKGLYDYGEMYRLLGYTLIELERIDEAKVALKKGIRWNPMDLKIQFEYFETFKATNQDKFLDLSKKAMKIAYLPKDIARIYRNIGYVLIEKENYKAAYYCYLLSNSWEQNEKNSIELYYIEHASGQEFELPSTEELFACLEENDIPIGPDEKIVAILYHIARAFENENYYTDAISVYTLLNNLINDDSITKLIEGLKRIETPTK